MFYRVYTDHSRHSVPLDNLYAGPQKTPCWIIGGGPSLGRLPIARIAASPLPKFAMNLAGAGLLRPTFWTSYDPTSRFQKSIYLDPSIQKFVHTCRAMDLIPETTFKVCEAPNLLCFDRTRGRGFVDFPTPASATVERSFKVDEADLRPGVTDWQDSLIQAIDIAFRLGFRQLYLAGCELFIAPPPALLELSRQHRVHYEPREPMSRFLQRCRQAGCSRDLLEKHAIVGQYHFDELKPFGAAVQTDEHYYRVTQYLRLSRRALSLAGLELISVTPQSRLNDYFPYQDVNSVLHTQFAAIGDPQQEATRGRYTSQTSRHPSGLIPMRDYRPHNWHVAQKPAPVPVIPEEDIPVEIG